MHNIKDFDFKWAGAYEEQFNVRLFNTAVRLATETTEAHKENPALLQKLAHLPWYQRVSGMDYFESREIRYFGELLERYGEKLGDDIANTRAVALAMAWTAPILTPNMFVGRQREDFMLKLNLLGEGDPYIAAALYHLSEGAVKDAWRANLTVREYARTEEIILALCSMDDPEASYDDFRPALIPLLAEKRTLPVEENAGIYGWLVWSCFGAIKACRKKDNAIPKAIQALALGYLREDKPAHKALMGAGYTLLDILYLNSAFVWDGNFGGCGLSSNSIPAERLATAFVQAVLSAPEPQKASTLDYVHWLASRYTSFEVKFEGNAGLWMAVCVGLKVVCPETMVWLCDRDYSFNYRFDPLDSRWDLLAKDLPDIKYDKLFRDQLEAEPNASAEWYSAMLAKYEGLTGRDYLAFFDEYRHEYTRSFPILVNAGIIDLWDFFERHQDDKSTGSRYNSLEYVWSFTSGVQNRKAYDFWKRFFEDHTARDILRLFPDKQFHDGFYERVHSYWSSGKRLKYKRDFLSREENRLLYEWIEASAFVMTPDDFPNRAAEFLESADTAELFEIGELRPIFEALIADNSQSSVLCGLKRRFMSEEELEAEKKAKEEKQRQLELARADAERRQTVSKMDEKFDGTIKSIADFLDSVKWRRDERRYAAENAEYLLVDALKDRTVLSREEYRLLLDILSDIVAYADGDDNLVRGVLKHMTMVKEERKAC